MWAASNRLGWAALATDRHLAGTPQKQQTNQDTTLSRPRFCPSPKRCTLRYRSTVRTAYLCIIDEYYTFAFLKRYSLRMAQAANKRWHIAVLLGLGVLINFLDRVNLSVAHGALQSAFGMSDVFFGYMLSAYSWTYAALQLPSGALLDRLGVRRVMLGATALWTLASALAAAAPSAIFLFGARLLLGVGEAPAFPANAKAIGLWFGPRERSAPTAIFDAAAKLSVGLGTPLLGLVLLRYGMRFSFAATAVLSLLYTALFALVYRDPRPHEVPTDEALPHAPQPGSADSLSDRHPTAPGLPIRESAPRQAPGATQAHFAAGSLAPALQPATQAAPAGKPLLPDSSAASAADSDPSSPTPIRLADLLRSRKILGAALGSGAYNYCFYLMLTWLPVYLERGVHLTPRRAVLLSGIPWLVAAAADFFIGGLLVDALLRRGRDADRVRRSVLLGGSALGLFIFAPAITHASIAVVVCLSLGLGGLSAAAPIVWTLPSLLAPPGGSGRVGSILNFMGQIAAITAPIATGYISRETHSFTLAFVVAGTILLLGLGSYSLLLGRIEPIR